MKYFQKVIALNFRPLFWMVILSMFVLLLTLIGITEVIAIEFFLVIFALPAYLLFINTKLAIEHKKRSLFASLLPMLLVILICELLNYLVVYLSLGLEGVANDGEAVALLVFACLIPLVIIVFMTLILSLVLLFKSGQKVS